MAVSVLSTSRNRPKQSDNLSDLNIGACFSTLYESKSAETLPTKTADSNVPGFSTLYESKSAETVEFHKQRLQFCKFQYSLRVEIGRNDGEITGALCADAFQYSLRVEIGRNHGGTPMISMVRVFQYSLRVEIGRNFLDCCTFKC